MDGWTDGREDRMQEEKGSHGGEWPEDIKSDDRTLPKTEAVKLYHIALYYSPPPPPLDTFSSLFPRTEQKYYTLLKSLNAHIKPTASNYNAKGNLKRKNK